MSVRLARPVGSVLLLPPPPSLPLPPPTRLLAPVASTARIRAAAPSPPFPGSSCASSKMT